MYIITANHDMFYRPSEGTWKHAPMDIAAYYFEADFATAHSTLQDAIQAYGDYADISCICLDVVQPLEQVA